MDRDFLHELFAPFGAITVKRMFGGFGLSAERLTFAIVASDVLYLKADAETMSRFELEGSAPFSYEAKGRPHVMTSYWRMPERLYDDPDETADWARAALAAARRAALKKQAVKLGRKAVQKKASLKKAKRE